MSVCSRAIPLWTPTVLKILDEDSTRQSFVPGASNFRRAGMPSLFTRHVWIVELRADCAVFWRAGRNRRRIGGCRITNNQYRSQSFFVRASKRRSLGLVCGSAHAELSHAADGLY